MTALLEHVESRLTTSASLGPMLIPMLEHVSGDVVSSGLAYEVDGLKGTDAVALRVVRV